MKKVLSCLLAVLLLASFGVMAFAEEVVPSVEPAAGVPEVSAATDAEGNDVTSAIVITDCADKDTLPEEKQEQLDAAAAAFKDLEALLAENEELKALVGDNKVDMESLFDISVEGDDIVLPVELSLELVNPDNFAALLHFVDGAASVVEAEVDGDILKMVLEEAGVYAVLAFAEE